MSQLDLNKIKKRVVKTVSIDEALKNIEPFDWPNGIADGSKKAIVKDCKIEGNSPCVRLEIL